MALFSDEEIESIREICNLRTAELPALTAALTPLNDAQADACRSDIRQWNRVRYGTAGVSGGMKGTEYNIDNDRDLITARMRRRLDFPAIPGSLSSTNMGFFSINIGGWSDE